MIFRCGKSCNCSLNNRIIRDGGCLTGGGVISQMETGEPHDNDVFCIFAL